jgi:hypothetical protein
MRRIDESSIVVSTVWALAIQRRSRRRLQEFQIAIAGCGLAAMTHVYPLHAPMFLGLFG